ncbi:MAG: zinc-dependent alcohol dehydrogenase family protein [Pseudomonadota bacterium]
MKAVVYEAFGEQPHVAEVPEPEAPPEGVVIEVKATGVCRSDWHGWKGHDKDIRLPHVPGHEFAGVVHAVGAGVSRFKVGDRVTVPFVAGCGRCEQCESGNQQVCDNQSQPGFTHWGSFADYVAVHYADTNLVSLPDDMSFATAASLGCRFATSFRAVVDQGNVEKGQWVAVYGCGGVGLSAIMIAAALGARVVAIDVNNEALEFARDCGAAATINADEEHSVVEVVREATRGGAHVSLDALGKPSTLRQSVQSLRKRGRHVQVGLLIADKASPRVPMDIVVANELEIVGSHGMQAHRYDEMLDMIGSGKLEPEKLIGRTISLDEAADALAGMKRSAAAGVTIVEMS